MQNENLVISIPGGADHGELLQVWESAVRATHSFLTEEHLQFYKQLIAEGYLHSLELYCIREQSKILGFMGIEGRVLQMLFVHENYRGRGIGAKLLSYAVNVKHVKNLEVNEQNTGAVGFYGHFGFKAVSRAEVDGAGNPYPTLSMVLEGQGMLL